MLLPGFGSFFYWSLSSTCWTLFNDTTLGAGPLLRQMFLTYLERPVAPPSEARNKLVSTPHTYFGHSAPPGRGSLAKACGSRQA